MNKEETLKIITKLIKNECSELNHLIIKDCNDYMHENPLIRADIREYRAALKYIRDNLK